MTSKRAMPGSRTLDLAFAMVAAWNASPVNFMVTSSGCTPALISAFSRKNSEGEFWASAIVIENGGEKGEIFQTKNQLKYAAENGSQRALDEFIIEGVKTTIPMHKKILAEPDFQKGDISTKFMERYNHTAS